MKDAPPASEKEPYNCGEGDKKFYEPSDSTEYNQYARCSECFSKTLQVRIKSLLNIY
jgi:DNA-directed RNA polymerase subunit RPC12/RpoP